MRGKKVLVIGLGISGAAAANFLLDRGAYVHGVDRNLSTPAIDALRERGATIRLDSVPCDVSFFDLIVVSPGIPQDHLLYREAQKAGVEVIGELELGCRYATQRMIGITGTNGKTTVTLLITHVLNDNGWHAKALGNVGVPITKEISLAKPSDVLIMELSSYQLETLTSPVLNAAVILNITPDHLDRYKNMDAYACAKFRIGNCLKKGAPLYIEGKTMAEYGSLLDPEYVIRTYGYSKDDFLSTDLITLVQAGETVGLLPSSYQGKASHDLENLMAAYAMCYEVGVTFAQFIKSLESFKKPSHRIQFIRERQGVFYYDDSKGTNIDAVIRAVERMPGKVVLIAGGVDKGAAYTPWIKEFDHKVKGICAIGQAAKKIERELSHAIPVSIHLSLKEAVEAASNLAEKGDAVLLSPGCSSFDMFRDYAQRGEEFQRFVHLLD